MKIADSVLLSLFINNCSKFLMVTITTESELVNANRHQSSQQNDRAMIRQICNVKPQDTAKLLAQLGIEDLNLILKERRLRWFGHVERSNCAVKKAFDIQIVRKRGPGRPKMTWKQLTGQHCRKWKLSAIDPHDRDTWRSGARSAMHAASQLLGRGPLLWILPLYLHVNQKSDDDDDSCAVL